MFIKTLIVIFIIFLLILIRTEKYEVKYVVSTTDGEKYLVRDLPDMQVAANTLANIKQNMLLINQYLQNNKDKHKEHIIYINQLNDRIHDITYSETNEDNMYTSYSINKGEQIVFCLRSKKNKNILHDFNLIMYVALHEISHVACPSYGHGDEFKKVFSFIAKTAVDLNIYKKIDFNMKPEEYCGISIADSII